MIDNVVMGVDNEQVYKAGILDLVRYIHTYIQKGIFLSSKKAN